MYNSLENHVFDSYLQQSPSQFTDCDDSGEDYDTWLSLYNWTRNTYSIFSKKPELLIKQLHDDCDLPGIFGTYSTLQNGAKIKTAFKAYTKANFKIEGVMKQAFFRDDKFHDKVIMAILREEWINTQ